MKIFREKILLRKKSGHSFFVKNHDTSISEGFRAIRALQVVQILLGKKNVTYFLVISAHLRSDNDLRRDYHF